MSILQCTSVKWNASSLTLIEVVSTLVIQNDQEYVDMTFESHIRHVPFDGAALKNPTFCCSEKRS